MALTSTKQNIKQNTKQNAKQKPAPHGTSVIHYIIRLIGSQRIRTITDEWWYQPREVINASATAQPLPVVEATALPKQLTQTLNDYLVQQNSHAFLVMQHGQLQHAHYHQFDASQVFNSKSLMKSVLGLCIGIALDKGMLSSIQAKAADYLPEWRVDARKNITLEHLITMQSGLKSDSTFLKLPHFLPPVVRLYLGSYLHHTALSLPSVAPAGQYFEYNNFNSQILGIILERVSGMSIAQFIWQHLWQHLNGFEASLWLDRVDGNARTFGAMFARPEDWLKLGQLFLDKGQCNGKQIVSAQWLEQMIVPRNTPERGVKQGKADYGYHIWLKAHDYGLVRGIPSYEATHAKEAHHDDTVFYFEGMRAQYVFISPKHQLVVMRMGERPRKNWDGSYVINQITRALSQ